MRLYALAATFAALVLVAPAPAGPIPVVVVGDSLSDPYYHYQGAVNPSTGRPFWGRARDMNWVEQLQTHQGSGLTFYNYSQAGATTADLLSNGATDKAAIRERFFGVHNVAVLAGSEDVLSYVNGKLGNDPATFISGLSDRLNSILSKIDAAGSVHLVVGNLPDMAVTPSMEAQLGGTPGALAALTSLIEGTNQAIAAVAAAHHAAVVDLFGLSQLTTGPLTMAGTTVPSDKFFAPDGFHPATVTQGLLANTILSAFGGGLGTLKLTDQQILTQAHITPVDAGPTFTDVSPFVRKTPEPASLVLLSLAVGVVGFRYRRRV
jgi:phospholipase/lecithinase/hemolysin